MATQAVEQSTEAKPRTYQVISGDSHIEVHPDDWCAWVPDKYKDRAPRILRNADGVECWAIEGAPLMPLGPEVSAGDDPSVLKRLNNSFYEPDGQTRRPGLGDAVQKLHELDYEEVDAEVLFPGFFASQLLKKIDDAPAYVAIVQAYNSWLAEAYCSVAPDRLLGLGIVPETNVDDAIAEMKRCKQLGLRGIALKQWPNGGGRYQPEDDKFFEAILEADMRLTPHIFLGAPFPTFGAALARETSFKFLEGPQNPERKYYAYMGHGHATAGNILELIMFGVLDRFPELRIYFGESFAYWVPDWLHNAQDWYNTYHHWYGMSLKRPLDEYLRDHAIFNFVRGASDVHRAHEWGGEKNVTWGSDCPHSQTTFPWSKAWRERALDGESDAVRRLVLVDTLADFFGLDTQKALTPTPLGGPYEHPNLQKEAPFHRDADSGRFVPAFD